MESIKKFKQKRSKKRNKKRNIIKNIKEQKGRVLSRRKGRLKRTKDYIMIFYFLTGIIFLTVMIFSILGMI